MATDTPEGLFTYQLYTVSKWRMVNTRTVHATSAQTAVAEAIAAGSAKAEAAPAVPVNGYPEGKFTVCHGDIASAVA